MPTMNARLAKLESIERARLNAAIDATVANYTGEERKAAYEYFKSQATEEGRSIDESTEWQPGDLPIGFLRVVLKMYEDWLAEHRAGGMHDFAM